MSGDNIIRPAFGSHTTPRPALHQQVPSEPLAAFESVQTADIEYYLGHLERVTNAFIQADDMTDYLFDVVGYNKNDQSLELRRPVVRAYTLEEFCDRLLGSDRKEWTSQPAFFGALYLEFNNRHVLVAQEMLKHKEQVQALCQSDVTLLLALVTRADNSGIM